MVHVGKYTIHGSHGIYHPESFPTVPNGTFCCFQLHSDGPDMWQYPVVTAIADIPNSDPKNCAIPWKNADPCDGQRLCQRPLPPSDFSCICIPGICLGSTLFWMVVPQCFQFCGDNQIPIEIADCTMMWTHCESLNEITWAFSKVMCRSIYTRQMKSLVKWSLSQGTYSKGSNLPKATLTGK